VGFVWIDPPVLLGQTSFLSRLLEKLGYQNALGGRLHAPYLPITEEWLVQARADTVVFLTMPEGPVALAQEKFRRWWPNGHGETLLLNADAFARASLTPFENLSR